ncbi:hypothetical protein [Acinetobacter baumannii]|uniref:hypothetical protein n=1 Tax=Acinetobacter baumannii TaxID=470 RepID=UPI001126B87E|nr:hypothetical protein [Acinetobacter baumannii]TPT13151.1 hypothetical protein FJU73_12555 [Acinetobacter baumannii]
MIFTEEELNSLVSLKETAGIINDIEQFIFKDTGKQDNIDLEANISEYQLVRTFQLIKELIQILNDFFTKKNVLTEFRELYIENLNQSLYKVLDVKENNKTKYTLMLETILLFARKIVFENPETVSYMENVGLYKLVKNIYDSLKGYINELKNIDLNDISNIENFFQKYTDLDGRLKDFSNRYIVFENEFRSKMDNFFVTKGRDFDKSIDNILLNFNKRLVEVQTPYENEVKTKISGLNSKYEESQSELTTLLGNLKSYKNILSDKTQDEISKHYFLKAQSEKRMYWVTTITSVLLILISLSSVGWALYDYYHDYISITSCVDKANIDVCLKNLKVLREASQSFGLTFFIMRFVFSLLLFLTVIYTSRIAIRAYNHWRHSENMHLKLVSLNPFIGNLDKDKRDEIHIGLVPDYFGKDAGVIEFQKDGFKDIPTNVANVAIKALEQAGGTFGGKSNTEKNDKKPDSGTE